MAEKARGDPSELDEFADVFFFPISPRQSAKLEGLQPHIQPESDCAAEAVDVGAAV